MKSRKAASLSSGLLARKGDASPVSMSGFGSSEPDEIPPFAKENDVSPDFVSPGLDAAGANARSFGSSDLYTGNEVPLVYTDGEGEQPKIGTVLQPLPRFDARTYLQDTRRRRRRRQARWIVGTFLVAAVAGFGAVSWLGEEGTFRLPDALDTVVDAFVPIMAVVQGDSGQGPSDVAQGPGTGQEGGDDGPVALLAPQGAERAGPQRGLPAVDAAIESPRPESGSPPSGSLARGRKSDLPIEPVPPTLGIAEAGAEPGMDIGMKDVAAFSMNTVALRSPALGPGPLKIVPPSSPPARLALAATVVALTRPPIMPLGRVTHPPAASVAKILLPASPPDSAMKSMPLDAPVPESLLAKKQERVGDGAEIGGGAEPGDGDVILGTAIFAARSAGRAAMTHEKGGAGSGDKAVSEAPFDQTLGGAQQLSLAAILLPQSKPAASMPPSSRRAAAGNMITAAKGSRRNYVVQLLSVTTEEGAAQELAKIIKRFPALLEGLGVTVHRAELPDQGSRFRVRTAPFGTRADAEAFCSRLKDLNQDCLILLL